MQFIRTNSRCRFFLDKFYFDSFFDATASLTLLHHFHLQGCHLHGAQSGTSEESAAASEAEHVRRFSDVVASIPS